MLVLFYSTTLLSLFSAFSQNLSSIEAPPSLVGKTFACLPYVNNIESPAFLNVSVLVWAPSSDPLALSQLRGAFADNPLPAPRALLIYASSDLFPDDYARELTGLFDVLLIKDSDAFIPEGWAALTDRRITQKTEIPVYETTLDLPRDGSFTADIRLSLVPEDNHYSSVVRKWPYSFFVAALSLNLSKVCFTGPMLADRVRKKRVLEPGTAVLVIEALSGLCNACLAVDFQGLYGLYTPQFYYPMIQLAQWWTFLSIFVLTYAFQAALREVEEEQVYKLQMALGRVMILVSFLVPLIVSLWWITRSFTLPLYVTLINVANSLVFQLVFGVTFFKSKSKVIHIMAAGAEYGSTQLRHKIKKMSRFMYYAAFLILGNVVLSGWLVLMVASLDGPGLIAVLGTDGLVLTAIGWCQVLSLPRVTK